MNIVKVCKAFVTLLLLTWLVPAWSAVSLQRAVGEIQHGWASVLYQTPPDKKEAGYRELSARANAVSAQFPGEVEPMVWEAIVLGSYADFQNGLGALGKLKRARALLLDAQALDRTGLNPTIPMVLGVLHYKAPGWPLSFGDRSKARAYLEAALRIDPDGMDQNFYFGEFLLQQHETAAAISRLKKAFAAAPRPGREDADDGRRVEIERLLRSTQQD